MFMLTITEANCAMQNGGYWLAQAERKYNRIVEMQARKAESGEELTVSERADVEYAEKILPERIAATKSLLAKIRANAKENVTCPVEIL